MPLTLSELRALAAGADWIAHQDGCASVTERPCSCGATELRMALLPLFGVAMAARGRADAVAAWRVAAGAVTIAPDDEVDARLVEFQAAEEREFAGEAWLAAALAELAKVAS